MKQRLRVSILLLFCLTAMARAQAQTAVINGQVRDTSGAAIAGATVEVFNDATRVRFSTETNDEGIYSVPSLAPGTYHIQVSKSGFKTVVHPDITLNIQDAKAIGFILPVGAISDTVTVEGGAPLINTESATVSTVVDRQFAENLPMNGRSFQTLIQLSPGVVVTTSSFGDSGQFSVNGQRAASNYWMVDGVSANIGIGIHPSGYVGNGLGGALGSFSAMGGTNSLVSVDALQEFRIQTSTYAPEFGRTPGGQISIVTRSGTNQFHGTLFDYFRNDVLDAWFAIFKKLRNREERQNVFGGILDGQILEDRSFFFCSYEGLRLGLPQLLLTDVPTAAARRNASPALQPFLNAFPLPNGSSSGTDQAEYNASFSSKATLDAYSVRIDHKLNRELTLFGRYNYSPSDLIQRGGTYSLGTVNPTRITTQTATIGTTWIISPVTTNDLRFNFSKVNASDYFYQDGFGGAVPVTSLPFPSPFTSQNALFSFVVFSLRGGAMNVGQNLRNLQRQINIVDSLSVQRGSHSLKFGADFRRLSPIVDPSPYQQTPNFLDVPSAENGNLFFGVTTSNLRPTFLFRNLGIFAQDTWRIVPHLTLTYGLRWDVDFVPQSIEGPSFNAVTGFNLNNLSKLALAPAGTPPYKTTYGNFSPRLGLAYQLTQSQDWQTVLRGGFGIFYDLATAETGNQISVGVYPFGGLNFIPGPIFGGTAQFPLSTSDAAPPPITPPKGDNNVALFGFDPQLQLPYTLEWNVALEQALGRQQTISASYIGSVGRRLVQTESVFSPNPTISSAQLVTNSGTSDYTALQIQFQRRLSRGLQALASYTWSHSIDTASAGSVFGDNGANTLVPGPNPNANRGPSDFDIRNAFSAGVTYDIPALRINAFTNAILRGWSIENIIQVRSAPPVEVSDGTFFGSSFNNGVTTDIRPDRVPGQPLYLYGSKYPGGKAFNPSAFKDPPVDPNTGNPARQGTLGRNALGGFGAAQWDFAVHRNIPIHESLKVQFRAEMFNVLNHPNFGPPRPVFGIGGFGVSAQLLGQALSGSNVGGGSFSPLYQIGGPRSVQCHFARGAFKYSNAKFPATAASVTTARTRCARLRPEGKPSSGSFIRNSAFRSTPAESSVLDLRKSKRRRFIR